MPRADEPLDERTAAKAAVLPLLTGEFLRVLTRAVIAMDGDDQANGIAFALACYEMAGKVAPEFGGFSEAAYSGTQSAPTHQYGSEGLESTR